MWLLPSSTVSSVPLTESLLPQERSDPHSRTQPAGKRRSSMRRRKTCPTAPVAPITAMLKPFNPPSGREYGLGRIINRKRE